MTILLLCFSCITYANTIVVGKDKVITSLKKAIELAEADDTILLNKGVYREGNIVISKPLRLIGVDGPILDGEHRYEILTLTGTDIIVKGIHFRNSGYSSLHDFASIHVVDAKFVIIENNIIEEGYFSIRLANVKNSLVSGNRIKGLTKTEQTSGNGIHVWKCDSIVVEDNEVAGHRDGIYFEFVTNSSIYNNNSHGNIRYGLHFMFSNHDDYVDNHFEKNGSGVAVMYSHHVLMLGNSFDANWGPNAYGILLKEISDATVSRNHFTKNTVAILMESTNRIDVAQNDFNSNGWALRIQASCDQNVIRYNSFYGNTFDVATNGTMMLNEFYNNYWDKYDGYDLNKDDLGDLAYHPVSMYSMVIEQNPNSLLLLRSFMVTLLDKAEKAIPSLTPANLADPKPLMKRMHYDQN